MNPIVRAKFARYPEEARRQLKRVRSLILEVAAENELGDVQETLKWDEPSYLVRGGTPIRIDWKSADPDAIKMFVHCQTRLIETCRVIYPDAFAYEGNREIAIPLTADVDELPLAHVISLALRYHSVKHLPLLGA